MTRHAAVGALTCVTAASLLALVVAVAGVQPAAQTRAERPPLAPAEALASFQIEPDYRIDLVAAEPLVQDPVADRIRRARPPATSSRTAAIRIPSRASPAGVPMGRVALLTDTDGDGRYDTRTEFATGLTYPNGVMVWDGGVFVTVAPDLLYLKDTTGDGVADVRRVALTGFNATRTAQIRFSHPTLGPDGWIYLTSGLNGGHVTSPAHPDRPAVEFASSDSRFHPRTGVFELVGGQGQYGLTFDDHGRRFICANRHPVWHVVLEPRQLARNPGLSFSGTVQEVSAVGAAGDGVAVERRPDDGLVPPVADADAARGNVHVGQRRAHPPRRRACRRDTRGSVFVDGVGPEPRPAPGAHGRRRVVPVAPRARRRRVPRHARLVVPPRVRRHRARRRAVRRRHVPEGHRPSGVRARGESARCSTSRRGATRAASTVWPLAHARRSASPEIWPAPGMTRWCRPCGMPTGGTATPRSA